MSIGSSLIRLYIHVGKLIWSPGYSVRQSHRSNTEEEIELSKLDI